MWFFYFKKMKKYKILDKSYFDEYPNADVIIQYVFSENGDSYEIGITSSMLKSEDDIENWFYSNYKTRPVTMIGYLTKHEI
jgi:hypothetical protein